MKLDPQMLTACIEVIAAKFSDSSTLTAETALQYSQAIEKLTVSMCTLAHFYTLEASNETR